MPPPHAYTPTLMSIYVLVTDTNQVSPPSPGLPSSCPHHSQEAHLVQAVECPAGHKGFHPVLVCRHCSQLGQGHAAAEGAPRQPAQKRRT